ncbi:hypothetical protein NCS57_00890800 [Fusarium keratoplasticum]|uniref:Uncharacterized protein n=1 Tax=Fusarium keratoplasticum TaxID=1328300 RepID=A0ACC0QVZ2_9HYPO|nr:hypothetical protein NCS57_00890800 [Fusarium keratoplasticum]KAI8666650.1 hypothetical protein NCS57_00890800 [Fusarium keratoplasticum]KAI8668348.1 hypothetical protein NCS55_00860200 [Fusarium keratoplasticum]
MSSTLLPTYVGYIHSTLDALIIFEACLSGARNHVPRRPQDRERQELIRSGNVFIYEEHASGIKRWTDGVSWSPSRILDNFLVYRELERPFGPGEKKRALKKPKKMSNGITKTEPRCETRDEDRALIGSLVDSYDFKQSGLVKKTISITFQGVPHHLVSYYTCEDVKSGRLTCPSNHPDLRNLIPRSELLMSQNFRAPIDGTDTSTDERYQSQVLVDYGYNTSMQQVPPMMSNYHMGYYYAQGQLPPIHMQQQQQQQHHHQHHPHQQPPQQHEPQQLMSPTHLQHLQQQQQQQQQHQQQQHHHSQQQAYVTMPPNTHLPTFSYMPEISGIDTSNMDNSNLF